MTAVLVVTAVAALTVVADLGTKRVVAARLVEGRLYGAAGWGLRRADNRRGSVVSVSPRLALAAWTVSAGCVVSILATRTSPPSPLVSAGFGLALGGAAGNVAGRFTRGAVIDFVAAGPWPLFNLADGAMVAGALLALAGVL